MKNNTRQEFYRNTEFTCGHCGKKQEKPTGLIFYGHNSSARYLDDGPSNLEEEYFNILCHNCGECGNIGPNIEVDNTNILQNENIKKIINSDKPQIEKNLLVLYEMQGNFKNLINLYHYYQYAKNEEQSYYCGDKLLKHFTLSFDRTKSLYHLRFMIELHRRRGDFQTALMLINTEYKKIVEEERRRNPNFISGINEHLMIEREKELCEQKISRREFWVL